MADDATNTRVLLDLFRFRLRRGTLTVAALEAIWIDAAERMIDGTTTFEVVFEGGSTRSTVNCAPASVCDAAKAAMDERDPANPLAGTSYEHRYADHSGGRIET